ncbi:branched-chain amino acid transport system II carrier protein [Acidovorax sp. Be4]|uniref:Branched-chain amino acid transport system carrier protein n=1 Tax=Acidovorax bellezanensis TaxID=2976702 RepID=A0ABT2PI90_9BURK|nr:branched-chain amino acid transport system II carrier protein [Acidovorax sp. Be4]MCT9809494.1 branched-chain amino acid transport system II carrier protein [Acidovorax sp. Be4]
MQTLQTRDLIALGFMTFALFLGAGNIIFPPMVGLAAGEHLWSAALGFLLTGVGLPLLTVVALARVGGGIDAITAPMGRIAGLLLGVAVYLTIGPLFATPRTATVSFEMGVAPFTGHGSGALLAYSAVYFGLVMLLALYPGKLIDTIGKLITPVLILALVVLGGAAFVLPAGSLLASAAPSSPAALAAGFVQGYQTMDALGALVFGIVIVTAIKDTGITDARLQTRYAVIAGVIAAIGLGLVYVSLMYLGAHSGSMVPDATTGVQVLTTYVQHTFGAPGSLLLAGVILLACLTTGVGLVSACSVYFSRIVPGISYRTMVVILSLVSMLISNQGLEQLIVVAVPVLEAIYPMAIALVAMSLLSSQWKSAPRVFMPVMLVALVFGLLNAAHSIHPTGWTSAWLLQLPGAAMGLGWLLPVAATLLACALLDRLQPVRA